MTEPYYSDDIVTLHAGDCVEVLAGLPDASVDSVCTDPPYGISFMGREWDQPDQYGSHRRGGSDRSFKAGPVGVDHLTTTERSASMHAGKYDLSPSAMESFERWCEAWARECLRVLKPGGHMLVFGSPRTYHRLVSGIEDAGFEIRDSIHWIYGSGFPKSLDVSKAIDKARDDKSDVLAVTSQLADLADAAGISRGDVDDHMGTSDMGGWWLSRLAHRCACPSVENWARLRDYVPGAHEMDAEVWRLNGRKGTPGEAWERREVVGVANGAGAKDPHSFGNGHNASYDIKAPATDEAKQWDGWGTALKPAHEPIVVARKPLAGTVAANVLEYGTGAINVDGCRVGRQEGDRTEYGRGALLDYAHESVALGKFNQNTPYEPHNAGRWPANIVLSDEAAQEMDRQSGAAGAHGASRGEGVSAGYRGDIPTGEPKEPGSGGASRFFPVFRYEAKADADERVTVDGVAHPTVKPLTLMRWLVRLVTPPGGVVLDPFTGSGTTLEAAVCERMRAVGIEREPQYVDLATARLNRRLDPVAYHRQVDGGGDGPTLFDLLDSDAEGAPAVPAPDGWRAWMHDDDCAIHEDGARLEACTCGMWDPEVRAARLDEGAAS